MTGGQKDTIISEISEGAVRRPFSHPQIRLG